MLNQSHLSRQVAKAPYYVSPAVDFFAPRLFAAIAVILLPFCFLPFEHFAERLETLQINGGGSIIVTAPHGIPHIRNGVEKPADAETTAIARAVVSEYDPNLFVSITWNQRFAKEIAERQGWEIHDPNQMSLKTMKSSPFYLALKREIKERKLITGGYSDLLVFDVHGMTDNHKCDVAIGTAAWESWQPDKARKTRACLERELNENIIDPLKSQFPVESGEEDWRANCFDGFTGDKNKQFVTVSRTAVNLGIGAVQLELSARLRHILKIKHPFIVAFATLLDVCHKEVFPEEDL